MLTKDDFEDLVSRRTGVPRARLTGGSRLDADLGLDSFGLLELAGGIAELGVDLGEREWLSSTTVGELYDHYLDRSKAVTGSLPAAVADLGATDNDVSPVRLEGKYFRLTPVLPQATPFLYSLSVSPDIGFRWRYRGSVPAYQQFEQELWQGMLAQFLVESIETSQPAGHVICYNPDLNLGHAYVGAVMAGQYLGTGLAAEPVRLFINYLFDVWPLRKLYLELPEFNFTQFASAAGRALHIEARLRDHDYYQGRRWDRLTLAAYRPGEEPAATDEFTR
ncbi:MULTISPECIES: phosphopantetheine-binding protein [Pseudofrankia]|uniref:phosphopantetheine-binding protein n=1 Tax=Pseudofrankia TaxID=2994363 RepID=UPI000234BEDF|nr:MULTISPECIES: phosphopantetheine-binding protein [Pseudofrankia]OHV41365.1 acetyltransferase [Pseudofrankia sp. EUN1h]